jgi:hypothetical protein
VANNARSSLLLKALNLAMEQNLHLCGKASCLKIFHATLSRLGWQAAALFAVVLIAAPNLILVAVRTLIALRGMDHGDKTVESNLALYENKKGSFSANRPLLFCLGPYGGVGGAMKDENNREEEESAIVDNETRWLSSSGHRRLGGGAGGDERYSAAMRLRKSAFFKQPIGMIEGDKNHDDSFVKYI